MQLLQPEPLAHRRQLVEERLHGPERGVVRRARVAAAELVVEDDTPPLPGQSAEALERIVRRAGPSVEGEQRQPSRLFPGPDHAVPRLELTERETAFHAAILTTKLVL